MDKGVYIAVFRLSRRRSVQVGRLGRFDFEPGVYFYVGSAQNGLDARLARHARVRKPMRWHVDYLSAKAEMLGAIVLAAPKPAECRLARELSRRYKRPAAHFGSSDCRCGGHLFYTPALDA